MQTVWRCISNKCTERLCPMGAKGGRWRIETKSKVRNRRCPLHRGERLEAGLGHTPTPVWICQNRGISKGIKNCFCLLCDRVCMEASLQRWSTETLERQEVRLSGKATLAVPVQRPYAAFKGRAKGALTAIPDELRGKIRPPISYTFLSPPVIVFP